MKASLILADPVTIDLVETSAGALNAWRRSAAERPTLVLLDNDPRLQALPEELIEGVKILLREGSDKAVSDGTDVQGAKPLVMPEMALSAALSAGWFSKVVWVPVIPTATEEFSLDGFRASFSQRAAVHQRDLAAFVLRDGKFKGTLQGVPFEVVPLKSLTDIQGPVVVHVDAGYFAPLYKNEVKKGFYEVLREVLVELRNARLNTFQVTVSYSNLGKDGLPLLTRFIAGDLAAIFARPELMDQKKPRLWEDREVFFYLQNFFDKERSMKTALAMLEYASDDAWVHYAHFIALTENKQAAGALKALERAVSLDPVYALEYLSLSEWAAQKGLPDKQITFLQLLADALPHNPSLRLILARAHLAKGSPEMARKILRGLKGVEWSPVYYRGMPELIVDLQRSK